MSVTIVSTPNTSTAPAAPDATAGDVASGDDFANVLQSQLALSGTQTPATTAAPLPLPVASTSPDDDRDTAGVSPDGAFDATSLLATMGFVAPQLNANTSAPIDADAASTVATGAEAGRGRNGTLPSATDPRANAPTDATAALADAAPTAAAASDTPAKFAVAAAAVDDTALARKVATETAPGEPSVPTENVHAGGHVGAGRHLAHNESTLSVATPVRDQDWAADFGQKVVWLASSETQSAQLTLNPPQMGPIEISLSVESGHASVSFASANAEVRDAIETALPKLREMLASSGIELGQTNVGAESFKQQQQGAWGSSSASRSTADNAILAADPAASLRSRTFATQRGNGLVDLFA